MIEHLEDPLEEAPSAPAPPRTGEVVHWMERRPISIGAAGISAAAAGAFALGAVAAVGVLAVLHWLSPQPLRRDRL